MVDLSTRDTYRGQPARCPACGVLMEEIDVGDALVDVCADCRGVWLDWFDGDPRVLTQQTEATLKESRPSLTSDVRATLESRGVAKAPHGCARCRDALMIEAYEMRAASPAVPDADPPIPAVSAVLVDIFRCGGCLGMFLSRGALEQVVALDVDFAPPSSAPGMLEPLPWQKLLTILKRFLGLS